jgi:hypothetical protein
MEHLLKLLTGCKEDEFLFITSIKLFIFLLSGTACVIIGIVIVFFDLRYPDDIALFFGIDPLADYEEYHLSKCLLCNYHLSACQIIVTNFKKFTIKA